MSNTAQLGKAPVIAGTNKAKTYIAVLLMVAAVLPSLWKPPHIDEESYLFIAGAISDHPHLPYHWWRAWQPFTAPADTSYIYAHPPLFSWILLAASKLGGLPSIGLLRLSMWPFVALLIYAFIRLSRILTGDRLAPALLAFACPAVLLVSHQSLMIDLPSIALSTAAVAFAWPYLKSGQDSQRTAALLGGLLLGLATLTKYPTLLYIPLFVGIAASGQRGWVRRSILVLTPALFLFAVWQLYSTLVYGTPHLYYVLSTADQIARSTQASRTLSVFMHLGTTVVSPIFALLVAYRMGRSPWLIAALISAATLTAISTQPWLDDIIPNRPESILGLISLFAAAFVSTIVLTGLLRRFRKNKDDQVLALWSFLILISVILTHNFTGGRYLAPASLPLTLLLWRSIRRPIPLRGIAILTTLSFFLASGIAFADLLWARAVQDKSLSASQWIQDNHPNEAIYYSGEWAFRYVAEEAGWQPLATYEGDKNALLVVASNSAPGVLPEELTSLARWSVDGTTLRTHSPSQGIGYYSELFGLLPYGISTDSIEEIEVYQLQAKSHAPTPIINKTEPR